MCQGNDPWMVGIRTAGYGGASTARSLDIDSMMNNPAGLASLTGTVIQTSGGSFFDDAYSGMDLRAGCRIGDWAIGVAIPVRTVSGIAETTIDPSNEGALTGQTLSDSTTIIGLSAARPIDSTWTIGATVKSTSQTLGNESVSGFGVDIGGIGHWDKTSIGIAVLNVIGSTSKWDSTPPEWASPKLALGIAHQWTDEVSISADLRFQNNNSGDFSIGADYTINPLLKISGGIHTLQDTPQLTGAVLIGDEKLRIDYGWSIHPELGTSQRLGVRYELN